MHGEVRQVSEMSNGPVRGSTAPEKATCSREHAAGAVVCRHGAGMASPSETDPPSSTCCVATDGWTADPYPNDLTRRTGLAGVT
jgi:hypothetical protein